MFLWCIVTELSFSSKFWKDDDLSLYVILNALSCIRFILLLRLRLWNIQTNGQYPNCHSIKAFIITAIINCDSIEAFIITATLSISLEDPFTFAYIRRYLLKHFKMFQKYFEMADHMPQMQHQSYDQQGTFLN